MTLSRLHPRVSHHCPLQALSVLYTHLMTVLYSACPPSTIVCLSSVSFLRGEETFADHHFQTQISACDAQPSDLDPGPSAIHVSLCIWRQMPTAGLGTATRSGGSGAGGVCGRKEIEGGGCDQIQPGWRRTSTEPWTGRDKILVSTASTHFKIKSPQVSLRSCSRVSFMCNAITKVLDNTQRMFGPTGEGCQVTGVK